MRFLEEIDARDRTDGTSFAKRLKQIPLETGRFLAMIARSAPAKQWIEIGTSAGYSTIWLSLAARKTNARITTFEVLEDKAALAAETFSICRLDDIVTLVHGDARSYLEAYSDIGFCFLDANEDVYLDCYELIIPRLAAGGVLVADNAISHYEKLKPMLQRCLNDRRVDSMIVPIGKGELFCRKI